MYLGNFSYFLKTHFALHHKLKDTTTVALEKEETYIQAKH
jgi:hypothetical protein